MCVWGGVAVGRASDSFPVSHEFESYQRLRWFPLGKTINQHYLVLVYSRNGFNRDLHQQNCFTIELKLSIINYIMNEAFTLWPYISVNNLFGLLSEYVKLCCLSDSIVV